MKNYPISYDSRFRSIRSFHITESLINSPPAKKEKNITTEQYIKRNVTP